MLPIDEHAKSGALVLIETDEKSDLLKFQWARWEEGEFATHIGWYDLKRVRGYLPASWVEHAGAMREALETHAEWARREKAGPDYGGMTRFTHPDGERISSEWFYGNVDLCAKAEVQTTEALAATEWPKKETRDD